jgi:hypothetical protein
MVDEVTGNPPEGGSVETEAPVEAAPATEAKSLLELGGSDAPAPAGSAAWPENWREEWAGGDDKALKRLARFTDPKAVAKSYFELEKKLSSRPAIPTLPENATEEQVAEYRKAIGVPEDGKYDNELGGGFVWSDYDKPILESFAEFAFKHNIPASEHKKSLAFIAEYQESERARRSALDAEVRQAAEESLREEWGPDYRRNVNATASLFAGLDEETKEEFFTTPMKRGGVIGDNPKLVAFFSKIARELNPAATLVPSSGGDPSKGVEETIAAYEKRMGEDRDGWFKDAKAQEHYAQLLTAREKMRSR